MASAADRPSTSAFAFSCLTAAMIPAPCRAALPRNLCDRMRRERPGSRTAPSSQASTSAVPRRVVAACSGCRQCQLEQGRPARLQCRPPAARCAARSKCDLRGGDRRAAGVTRTSGHRCCRKPALGVRGACRPSRRGAQPRPLPRPGSPGACASSNQPSAAARVPPSTEQARRRGWEALRPRRLAHPVLRSALAHPDTPLEARGAMQQQAPGARPDPQPAPAPDTSQQGASAVCPLVLPWAVCSVCCRCSKTSRCTASLPTVHTAGSAAPGQPGAAAAATPAQQAAALAALLPGAVGAGAAGMRPPLLPLPNTLPGISPALPAGMLPLAAPGAAAFFAARPPGQLQQPFFMPVPQQMAAAAAAAAAAGDAASRRPASRPSSRSSSGAAAAKKYCNCKNSRCLKL